MDANGSLRDRQPHQSLHGSVMNLCSEEKHYLLLAPSVLAPNENNCLINPAHGDYKRIAVSNVGPLSYDPRMFRKERSYRRH